MQKQGTRQGAMKVQDIGARTRWTTSESWCWGLKMLGIDNNICEREKRKTKQDDRQASMQVKLSITIVLKAQDMQLKAARQGCKFN